MLICHLLEDQGVSDVGHAKALKQPGCITDPAPRHELFHPLNEPLVVAVAVVVSRGVHSASASGLPRPTPPWPPPTRARAVPDILVQKILILAHLVQGEAPGELRSPPFLLTLLARLTKEQQREDEHALEMTRNLHLIRALMGLAQAP